MTKKLKALAILFSLSGASIAALPAAAQLDCIQEVDDGSGRQPCFTVGSGGDGGGGGGLPPPPPPIIYGQSAGDNAALDAFIKSYEAS
jgi:hypothetical protein